MMMMMMMMTYEQLNVQAQNRTKKIDRLFDVPLYRSSDLEDVDDHSAFVDDRECICTNAIRTGIAKSPTSDTSLKGPRDGNAYWLYFGRETSNKTGSYKKNNV